MRKTIVMFAATVCAALFVSALSLTFVSIDARPAAAANTTYTPEVLGSFEAKEGQSIARGVNTSGQVVGQAQKRLPNATSPLQLRAFFWDGGSIEDLGTLGGPTGAARGINDSGQTVGFSRPLPTSNQQQAFVTERGADGTTQLVALGALPDFPSSEAFAINESGQIVGRSSILPASGLIRSGRAFLYRENENGMAAMDNLGVLSEGDTYSEAWAINDSGQVVGESGTDEDHGQAFLYSGGSMKPLGILSGQLYSEAFGIDDSGQIVGWSYTSRSSVQGRAFIYRDGEMKDLGTLKDDSYSMARAIDEHGRVVGQSRDAGSQNRAFLWEDGVMTDLNTLIPADPSLKLLDAYAISESGKIVGSAIKDGLVRPFVLTPNDASAPNTTRTVSPGPDVAGWNNEDVTVTLDATDEGGSNVKEVTYRINGDVNTVHGDRATFDITTEGENTITYSATDHAGNTEVPKTLVVRIDKSAPEFSCDQPDDAWHGDDVTLDCTASDGGSGLANSADGNFSLSTNVADGEETDNASTSSKVLTDAARNSVTAGPIGGNKVDKKAPVVSITTSPSGDEYELGDDVTVSYACTDGGSGTASCSGRVASGGKLDTTRVGQHTFSVDASDEVGNVSLKSLVYHVKYDFTGFFSPVDNPEALNRVKAGSAIPVKFSLGGDQGLGIFAEANGSSFPRSGPIPCDSTDSVDAVEQTVSANSSGLIYDDATNLYTYVWKTRKDWTGCRQLVVKLDDGREYRANFKFFK
jgi:probable HAF family extracellular repeat protein